MVPASRRARTRRPGLGAHVGAPVAADLGLVADATERHPDELASEGAGHRLAERRLAHARGADQGEDRRRAPPPADRRARPRSACSLRTARCSRIRSFTSARPSWSSSSTARRLGDVEAVLGLARPTGSSNTVSSQVRIQPCSGLCSLVRSSLSISRSTALRHRSGIARLSTSAGLCGSRPASSPSPRSPSSLRMASSCRRSRNSRCVFSMPSPTSERIRSLSSASPSTSRAHAIAFVSRASRSRFSSTSTLRPVEARGTTRRCRPGSRFRARGPVGPRAARRGRCRHDGTVLAGQFGHGRSPAGSCTTRPPPRGPGARSARPRRRGPGRGPQHQGRWPWASRPRAPPGRRCRRGFQPATPSTVVRGTRSTAVAGAGAVGGGPGLRRLEGQGHDHLGQHDATRQGQQRQGRLQSVGGFGGLGGLGDLVHVGSSLTGGRVQDAITRLREHGTARGPVLFPTLPVSFSNWRHFSPYPGRSDAGWGGGEG